MELTKSFPPADDLIETLQGIDYKKHLNNFMDFVVTVCVIVAAVATVIRDKWQHYDCTERLQLAALQVKDFTMNVTVPVIQNAVIATYSAGQQVRYFYDLISSPLFITL